MLPNLPRRSIFRPKARKLSRKGKKARVGRIWESGRRRGKEHGSEQKVGSKNLPEKAELKIKQEKAKGSRCFPFAVHICRQCRQNKGFSALRATISKGVVKGRRDRKRSCGAVKASVYRRCYRGCMKSKGIRRF